jgi:hypothetical protein
VATKLPSAEYRVLHLPPLPERAERFHLLPSQRLIQSDSAAIWQIAQILKIDLVESEKPHALPTIPSAHHCAGLSEQAELPESVAERRKHLRHSVLWSEFEYQKLVHL